MFIAMNRFKIRPGKEDAFEAVWRSRDSRLHELPGFQTFYMLKGPSHPDHTLYSSHTVWRSQTDFDAWTRSDAFRDAHKGAGNHGDLYLGHPEFEGFSVVQAIVQDPEAA